MNFKIPITSKNDLINIDNDKLTAQEIALKILEETEEVLKELLSPGVLDEIRMYSLLSECYDLMQCCLIVFNRINNTNPELINKVSENHFKKLIRYGWSFKSILEVKEIQNFYSDEQNCI